MNTKTSAATKPHMLSHVECEAIVLCVVVGQCEAINDPYSSLPSRTVGEVTKAARKIAIGEFSAYQMRRAVKACIERGWLEETTYQRGKRTYQAVKVSHMSVAAYGALYYCLPPLKKAVRREIEAACLNIALAASNEFYARQEQQREEAARS